jgi:predicted anti-sigma-YlaC factor YlaD
MHLTQAQLDDYLDGIMDDAARSSVERHLVACDRCRRALDATRALLQTVTRERAVVTAPAELWPLVSAATIHLAEVRRRALASMRGVLLAGAIAIVAATAMITWKVARWTMSQSAGAPPAGAPGPGRHAGHPTVPTPPTPPKAPAP